MYIYTHTHTLNGGGGAFIGLSAKLIGHKFHIIAHQHLLNLRDIF